MRSDKIPKRAFYVVYDYGQGGIVGIIYARTAEEISNRFPDFNVFTEIQYNPTPKDVKVWESRTYDIDNTNWTLLDFADRIKTYDPERDLDR